MQDRFAGMQNHFSGMQNRFCYTENQNRCIENQNRCTENRNRCTENRNRYTGIYKRVNQNHLNSSELWVAPPSVALRGLSAAPLYQDLNHFRRIY